MSIRHAAIVLGLLIPAMASAAANKTVKTGPASYNIPLWEDGKVPLSQGDGPLDRPFLSVFLPPAGKENGTSVVIAPGGSNIMLMYGGEGMEIAERYNDWGVTAFVLTYRLAPRYKEDARILDGKRAIQSGEIPRGGVEAGSEARWLHRVFRWIQHGQIRGGGFRTRRLHLLRSGCTAQFPGPIISRSYTVRAVATPGEQLKDFPPTFLCAAEFDKGPAIGSAQLFADLTKAGAIAEIHVYQQGRHGFGSGFGSSNFSHWMPRLQHFLTEGGLLPGGAKQ